VRYANEFVLLRKKETTSTLMRNVTDSKCFGKRKVGKGNCKITSEELSKKSGQSLAAILRS
jgi:hypothetical protein